MNIKTVFYCPPTVPHRYSILPVGIVQLKSSNKNHDNEVLIFYI